MAPPGGVPNDKAGIREVYALLAQRDERDEEAHSTIIEKLDEVCLIVKGHDERVETNTKEIDKLRNRSNWFDGGLLLLNAIGVWLGIRQGDSVIL